MENINVQGLSSREGARQEQQQQQQQQQSDLSGGVGRTDLQNNISSNNTTDDDADNSDSNNNNKQDRGVGSREDRHGEDSDNDRDDPDADVDVDMIPQYNNIALQQQQQRPSSEIFNTTARDSVQLHPLQSLPLLHFPFSTSSSASTSTDLHNYQAPRQPLHDTKNNSTNNNAHHQSEYQQHQDKDTNNNNGHASVSLLHTPQEAVVGLDTSTTPTGTTRDELSAPSTTPGSQADTVESASSFREQNVTTTGSRRTQQSSIDPSPSSLSRSDSNQRHDNRFHPLYPAQQQPSTSASAGNSSLTTAMMEDRLSLHRLSPPDDLDGYSSSNNNNGRSRYSITSDKSLYESLPPLQQRHHHRSAAVEGSSSDRSRVSTSESTSQHPPPLQRVLSIASKDDNHNGNHNTPSSTQTMKHPKKWTSTESVYNRKVLSARGTPKGPLPMDVQISLLSSVLRHDPFNCPIRRTTQVWECISREQGVRARTCARRYDNIIQASIAGRERPVGTEEQIAIKKKLLDQLFVMMNQPQALVRMQKKKRYRSEEADRQLLLETIRLNPFAQKMGQVAKAWEDVRDALKMQVHARQCIRRVNRMIKPYQLRERMYHGSIPDDMKEENDELIKQVIQMMQASGQGGSLEDGEDDDDDSASDSDDQEETHRSRSRQSSDGSRGKGLGNGDDDVDESMRERRHHDALKSSTAMDVSVSPRSPALSLVQSPQTVATTPTASELEATTSAQKRRPRNSSQSSMSNVRYTTSNKRSTVDRSLDEMDMTPPTSLRHHPFESEFKPQRLWGSHPYSKERYSRIVHGTHPQRPSSRSSSSLQSDPHRPAKYTRSSSRDPLRDTAEDSQDRSMVLQSSSSSSAFRTPTSESDSRQQYHYDHQHNIYSQSNLHHSHSHSSSGHQLMDGQVSISSAQQDQQQQPATQLYRAILGEFQVVQRYLGQVEDERKRDKERQTEMGFMMDKLQFQLQQQQQSIEDLKHQLQHQNQQSHPQQQQLQLQGQQQQEDHRRTSQQFDHSRRSHVGDSPLFSTLSMNVSDQQQAKSLEDQQQQE
ncbi:hypothetical protein KI688_005576 [Linnemannia hyalina]|uniref:Uncharacterized protein n=1 Tax=Linnemannia hyalina TaxID=64524 RepID=A0A9P8BWX0_9FUNG|nr:hypothetical protein KI688_005576 [Linnemannia hyalina]